MTFRGDGELAAPRRLPPSSLLAQVQLGLLPAAPLSFPAQGLVRAGRGGGTGELALRAIATPAPWLDFWELCVDETVCPDDGGRGRGTEGTVGTREPTLKGGGSVFSPQHGHIGRARAKKLGEEL